MLLKTLREKIFNPKHYYLYLMVLLLLVAGVFRFYNLNWDLGNYFHPDERNIANAVTKIQFFSQLDPQFFAYGGFSIYLYRVAADLLFYITKDAAWTMNWGNINIIGRFFSALFSTLTIIPLYLLTKKISNGKAALLAIALYTFTVTSIQTAHYGVTESLITLIGVTICWLSIAFLEKKQWAIVIFLAIISGIGIASKTSAIIFLIMPFLAYLFAIIERGRFRKIIFEILVYLLVTFLVFTLFSPYTFLAWGKFMESMTYESGVATGSLPVVYTLQFNHTIPYLFQIKNFFWQIGLDTAFCLLGFAFVLFEAIRKKNRGLLIFSIFPLIYFLYVGSWHTKFIRYMVPIIPFLIVASAIFLIRVKAKFRLLGIALISFALIATMLWALAFFSIYLNPQTRIVASEWVYHNIPYGSRILNEQWDDGLPIPIDGFNPSEYQITSLAMYDQDGQSKIAYLSENLAQSNYIIFNSRRLYGTLIHLTEEYPITSKYYQLLFAGRLGYQEIEQFTSYPSLFGLTINDDSSEETFQVYDHPKVIIFKNIGNFSQNELAQILNGK